MTDTVYGSELLARLSAASGAASVVPIHPLFLAIPPLTLVHAFAVSHNTLLLSGYATHNRGKISLANNLFFNQLLLFGPLSVIAAMLAQPCPLLIAPEFVLIYGGVHLFNILSGLGPTLVRLSGVAGIGLLIDFVYLTADAFARSDGMAALGVEVIKSHPNALVASSPWANILIGWAVGVGSLLMLGMVSFEKVDWTLRTPTWLTTPSSLLSADYISSFLATLVYYIATTPQGLTAVQSPLSSPLLAPVLPVARTLQPMLNAVTASTLEQLQIRPRSKLLPASLTKTPLLTSGEARAVGALIVLTFSLGRRLKSTVLDRSSSSSARSAATPATPLSALRSSRASTPSKSANALSRGNGTPRKR